MVSVHQMTFFFTLGRHSVLNADIMGCTLIYQVDSYFNSIANKLDMLLYTGESVYCHTKVYNAVFLLEMASLQGDASVWVCQECKAVAVTI